MNGTTIISLLKPLISSVKKSRSLIFFILVFFVFGLFFYDSFIQLRGLVLRIIPIFLKNILFLVLSYNKSIIQFLLYLILIGWFPKVILVFIYFLGKVLNLSLKYAFNFFDNISTFFNMYIHIPFDFLIIYIFIDVFLDSDMYIIKYFNFIFKEFPFLSLFFILTLSLNIYFFITENIVSKDRFKKDNESKKTAQRVRT